MANSAERLHFLMNRRIFSLFALFSISLGALVFNSSVASAVEPDDTVPTSTDPFVLPNGLTCGYGDIDLWVTLTEGDDVYHTTPFQRTAVLALGGNDVIVAEGIKDCIFGGDGNDIISARIWTSQEQANGVGYNYWHIFHGNAGDDRLTGGIFGDVLNGGPNYDTLRGGSGSRQYDVCYNGESHSSCERILKIASWNY